MITRERVFLPPRIVLYGPEGIGKSDFGASSFNPVFIPVEEGTEDLDVDKFPQPKTYEEFRSYIKYIKNNDIENKTLIIDTADWLEKLIWDEVCEQRNVKSIEDIGYAKGYTFAQDKWNELLDHLDCIRKEKEMSIVFLSHAIIKRYDSPDVDPYDRYQLKLHQKAAARLTEWSDALIFANYVVSVNETDVGFNKKIRRGTGGQYRAMYACERPAFKAKNRYNLPCEMSFERGRSWQTLVQAIKEGRES